MAHCRTGWVANAFVIAAIFTHVGYTAVFNYIAAAWLLTAIITLAFGPRTTGQRLEVLNPVTADLAPQGAVRNHTAQSTR